MIWHLDFFNSRYTSEAEASHLLLDRRRSAILDYHNTVMGDISSAAIDSPHKYLSYTGLEAQKHLRF